MSEENLRKLSVSEESSDVSLVVNDEINLTAHNVILPVNTPIIQGGEVNIEAEKVDEEIINEVKTEETKNNEEVIKIKVKYSLNKIKKS